MRRGEGSSQQKLGGTRYLAVITDDGVSAPGLSIGSLRTVNLSADRAAFHVLMRFPAKFHPYLSILRVGRLTVLVGNLQSFEPPLGSARLQENKFIAASPRGCLTF
jgi:hypothetical protein